MSVLSLTTLATVRDTETPKRKHVGKAPPQASDADQRATIVDLLVTQVPVEVVAPYTAITAWIVNAVAKPTKDQPNPNQYVTLRWIVFAVLLLTVFALVWMVKRSKAPTAKSRFPALEITGAVVAAIAWAFLLPGSPIVPYINDPIYRSLIPGVIGFVAVMGNLMIATALQRPAGTAKAVAA